MTLTPTDPRWRPWIPMWLRRFMYWDADNDDAVHCRRCGAITGYRGSGQRSISYTCGKSCPKTIPQPPPPEPVLLNPVPRTP